MNRVRSVILILAALALISACSGTSAAPGATLTANTLFFDDFKNASSGWSLVNNDTGTAGYANGNFRISITPANSQIIAFPGKTFRGDVIIDVDARKSSGSDVNYYGVLCHYQNPDNYYMFLLTSDGYSGIVMNKAGVLSMISPGGNFLKMKGIKTGTASNHIRAECVGETLTLYANGTQVSLTYDESITGGDVGLVARSSRYIGGADVQFDNFRVTSP